MKRGWSFTAKGWMLVAAALTAVLFSRLRYPFLAVLVLGLLIGALLRFAHRNSL